MPTSGCPSPGVGAAVPAWGAPISQKLHQSSKMGAGSSTAFLRVCPGMAAGLRRVPSLCHLSPWHQELPRLGKAGSEFFCSLGSARGVHRRQRHIHGFLMGSARVL